MIFANRMYLLHLEVTEAFVEQKGSMGEAKEREREKVIK